MVATELRWLGALALALLAQHFLVGLGGTLGLGAALVERWDNLEELFDTPPAPPPTKFEVARNEHEINAQQKHSAEVAARLLQGKPLGTVDELEVPQPDEVRLAMPPVDEDSHELKCGLKIPAESLVVTRGVEIWVRSKYRGAGQGGTHHSWSYTVHMKNAGVDTVQMLTRHWIFTDATGKVSEMKGPGARGVTPVLRPGESWQYESGSSLATAHGAMHGSFQFETLRSVSGVLPSMFSGRVGRLALSSTDGLELAPCAGRTPAGASRARGLAACRHGTARGPAARGGLLPACISARISARTPA